MIDRVTFKGREALSFYGRGVSRCRRRRCEVFIRLGTFQSETSSQHPFHRRPRDEDANTSEKTAVIALTGSVAAEAPDQNCDRNTLSYRFWFLSLPYKYKYESSLQQYWYIWIFLPQEETGLSLSQCIVSLSMSREGNSLGVRALQLTTACPELHMTE